MDPKNFIEEVCNDLRPENNKSGVWEYHVKYHGNIPKPTEIISHLATADPRSIDPEQLVELLDDVDLYAACDPIKLISAIVEEQPKDIRVLQREDSCLGHMIKCLEEQEYPEDKIVGKWIVNENQHYVMSEGILFHFLFSRGKGKREVRAIKQLVVPDTLKEDVLQAYHEALTVGHHGVDRTFNVIKVKYYWDCLYNDIEKYVKSCLKCQQSTRSYNAKCAPLNPLPPGMPFEWVHMDFIGPFNRTAKGYNHILLIVDSHEMVRGISTSSNGCSNSSTDILQ